MGIDGQIPPRVSDYQTLSEEVGSVLNLNGNSNARLAYLVDRLYHKNDENGHLLVTGLLEKVKEAKGSTLPECEVAKVIHDAVSTQYRFHLTQALLLAEKLGDVTRQTHLLACREILKGSRESCAVSYECGFPPFINGIITEDFVPKWYKEITSS